MFKNIKYLLFILFTVFSINFVFAEFQMVCCADYGSTAIAATPMSCSNSQFQIGNEALTTLQITSNFCSSSSTSIERMGCIIDNMCYSTINNGAIYKYNGINYPSNHQCLGELVPISSSICQNNGNNDLNLGDSSSQSGESPIEQGTGAFDFGDYYFPDSLDIKESQNLCNAAGGPFGIFQTKNSCESINANGEPCLFNPFRSGLFTSKLSSSNIEDLQLSNEQSCIVRSSVKSCFMYKTQENCENNPSKDSSNNNDLQFGCSWINSSIYSEGIFNDNRGFCISNFNNETYFNSYAYPNRGNLILDSSFEGGIYDEYFNIVYYDTPFGDKVANITQNDHLIFNISDIQDYISYSFFIYSKLNNPEITLDDKFIELELIFYNRNNSIINSTIIRKNLNSEYSIDVLKFAFKKIGFGNFVSPIDSSNVRIKLSSNHPMLIDSVSFQYNPTGSIGLNNLIYSPEPIIPKEASNCNLCFESLGKNLCTQDKSDILGDCSYMVENSSQKYFSPIENYLGKNDNVKLNTILDKWKSQSLSNSILFCEMYLNQEQCLDEENYINSKYSKYHSLSDNTLCKWNENYGCFKDSNNDNKPDTVNLVPFLNTFDYGNNNFQFNFDNYNFSNPSGFSDFQLACDILPPNVVGYLYGNKTNGDLVMVNNNYNDEIIGNINLFLEISDYLMPACKEFNSIFQNNLFLEFKLNDEYLLKEIKTLNQVKSQTNFLKEYLIDVQENFLLYDGFNSIELNVLDQSGNRAKPIIFEFYGDFSGPKIDFFNENFWDFNNYGENNLIHITNIIGKGNVFKFNISDYSIVSSCNFNLDGINGVDPSFYESNGELDISNIVEDSLGRYSGEIIFNLSKITNTSTLGDTYNLNIQCSDIFEQISEFDVIFSIDLNTDLVIVSPTPYYNENSQTGFVGETFELNLASTANNIDSCGIRFETGEEFNLNINNFNSDNYFELSTYPGEEFRSNITGQITFNEPQGIKNGTIICTDALFNSIKGNILYIYDVSTPEVILNNIFSSNLNTKVVFLDNNWYIWHNFNSQTINNQDFLKNNLISDISLNNIRSPIKNISVSQFGNISCDEPFYLTNNNINPSQNINNQLNVSIYKSFPNRIICGGEEIEEKLENYQQTYTISTLSNTQGVLDFSFLVDLSNPSISLFGEGLSFNSDKNILYTSNLNPEIFIDFNVPSYRKFNCSIKSNDGRFDFINNYEEIESFKLQELGSISLLSGDVFLEISCSDIYGFSISKSFGVKHDNTNPELLDLTLVNGLNKYYRNLRNYQYPTFSDKIQFNLKNTNEDGYTCYYILDDSISNGMYECNDSIHKISFSNSGLQRTQDINFLFSSDSLCVPTQKFNNLVSQTAENSNFNSKIRFSGYCEDLVGLNTQEIQNIINIDFVVSDLVDLSFNYSNGFAYPTFKSIFPFDTSADFHISWDSNYLNSFFKFKSSGSQQGEIYSYSEKSKGIDLSNIEDGSYPIYGIVVSANEVIGQITSTLIVDGKDPILNVDIMDEYQGVLIGESTIINIESYDQESGLSKIEVSLDGKTIFSHNSVDQDFLFINKSIEEPIYSNFYSQNLNYDGSLSLINLKFGESYLLEVKVWDNGGNMANISKSFLVKDGIGLTIFPSSNTFVGTGSDKFTWFTKNSKPLLKFETSKEVDSCSIYPFIDDIWKTKGILNEGINLGSGFENTKFEYDLNNLESFNLDSNDIYFSQILIQCVNQGEVFNFTRNLNFVSILPDYVLSSTEGFILTQNPYLTTISVKAVTPFRYLTCSYNLNGVDYNFPQENTNFFSKELDLSGENKNQIHSLFLSCKDVLGTQGPIKEYKFSVEEVPISISNLKFDSGNSIQTLQNDNNIYLATNKNYEMTFLLNKKDSISCSYSASLTGGVISGTINFFKNLFSIGQKEIELSSNPYLFTVSNINFDRSGNFELNINCREGSVSKDFKYNIVSINSQDVENLPSLQIIN